MMGLRPVAEMQFADFISCAFDMITNFAAKARYRTGVGVPLVVRGPSGGGVHGGPFHSQNPEAYFAHTPGLKVVQPATAYDAKGLIKAAIRDDDPVIFFEHKAMYDETAEVPDDAYTIPFGEANVTREGDDVTIITMGRMVNFCNQAADNLKKDKIGCTVVDLRTTSPLDTETVLETASETGRVVVVDESHPRCNMAADISALICQEAFSDLKAPIKMVTGYHCPVPFSPALEDIYIPGPPKIEAAVRAVMGHA